MNRKKVIAIVGARPQFIKHFAFEIEAKKVFDLKTIHTGQHYDENMSNVFFNELGMSQPDYLLQLGGGNHGYQTGTMMMEIEKILLNEKPDLVVVYGDTNSTLAGALTAAKLHIPVAHVEAGLRSYNKEMPEEINRVLTDHISDLLFVPSEVSKDNLAKEGITQNVYVVGDIMKDLVLKSVENKWIRTPENLKYDYYYVTLHRPYNTDEKERLNYILDSLNDLNAKAVFAIHPRTRNAMRTFGLLEKDFPNILFIEPQSYFSSLGYLYHSLGLITDSGGMQKEAYWLRKKCVTVRKETEWVETLSGDANELLFSDLNKLRTCFSKKTASFNDGLYGNGDTTKSIILAIT
ncbi:MAG: UDP-N-acetylglucosamine 2-epimerase (non-hydrolyzing) [Saprospiraceae bacterium]|nr:UDP-N-acetylglucosamine 2-epimerase (non-hydrolyzing) [Saprospiraceae bacterium]